MKALSNLLMVLLACCLTWLGCRKAPPPELPLEESGQAVSIVDAPSTPPPPPLPAAGAPKFEGEESPLVEVSPATPVQPMPGLPPGTERDAVIAAQAAMTAELEPPADFHPATIGGGINPPPRDYSKTAARLNALLTSPRLTDEEAAMVQKAVAKLEADLARRAAAGDQEAQRALEELASRTNRVPR